MVGYVGLKNWRRIATRYDRHAQNYLAVIALVAVVSGRTKWVRYLASKPADDPGDHVLCNAPSPLAQEHIVPVRWLKLVRGAV
jgi:hypothetical protein